MKLLRLSPMLRTTKLAETNSFYTNTLGFVCQNYSEEWGWAALRRDQVVIMASLPNEHLPFDKPAFTGSLYMEMDDVDAFWEEIKEKVRICYPLETFPYGMGEFAIYDNNGYLLQFGQNTLADATS